jgi:hypothetical protein
MLVLYDPSGKMLGYPSGGTVASVDMVAPVTGTYTVLLYDSSGGNAATGQYELTLTVTGAKP